MDTRKEMTEKEAFVRLSAKCAVTEYCRADMRRMMARWDMPDDARERVLARLQKEGFVDDRRYAGAFTRDKFRYNKWGVVKIALQLRMKGIAPDIIDEAVKEVDDDTALATLRKIIEAKRTTVKGKSDYEVNCKLLRFALSRGFSIDNINKVLHTDFDD